MSNLMQASNQWRTRPADQRFTSLTALNDHCQAMRRQSTGKVLSSRAIEVQPVEGTKDGLVAVGPNGSPANFTHFSFGQLAQRAGAPAGYLRDLPAPIAADCLNYGLKFHRDVEDIGVLLYKNGETSLRAVTGPNYGRIWNSTITSALVDRFGDGINGHFRVPGEFGQRIDVTKDNTTLYASDRDMFVFLADEERRITVPNRRNGQAGSLARGFFVWNSEVGAATVRRGPVSFRLRLLQPDRLGCSGLQGDQDQAHRQRPRPLDRGGQPGHRSLRPVKHGRRDRGHPGGAGEEDRQP